jgi:excisionase family DNA binding protein
MEDLNGAGVILTVKEVARVLQLSRNSTYSAVRRGEIPSLMFGRQILIQRAGLERLLGEGMMVEPCQTDDEAEMDATIR